MQLAIGDRIRHRLSGQWMVITGFASGMVECRWYNGYAIQREAFREDELFIQ
ncbi:DUF2158 domain-containing protein [Apirhabdus apintestini]|uniref:YodC family protein n=1 Tax=Erwinia sp. HR93 TaxID=3094840 RepID=UPI002ADEB728|nr:DUF2158 domain-containing protein [Erwinia sp. HR93]MEA1065306.1 DUF2158 domain-containing protein [Erwinia sp. HR93]WPM84696.1 DUF2158 domain-containing protein [Enterobacteriaceae bacterium CA-0114]WPM85655.1 DUF2158 domain-containing protein [Enterobacteriaceae bacterium CA-0114]